MSTLALVLVLAGSLLHVGWNALAKDASDKLAFLWLALLPPALLGTPLLLWLGLRGDLPWRGVLCVLASGVVHAFYFWFLTGAYGRGNLSFVYPYSRGIGALLATAGGIALLSDRPTLAGWIGIGLTVGATFVEGIGGRRERVDWLSVGLTAATGLAIASYLVIDKVGVGYLHPALYLVGILTGPAWLLAPWLLPNGRARAIWRQAPGRVASASFFLCAAYGVVLAAMRMAPVSYVVAARATGIVASGIAGHYLFKEQISGRRWLAILLITIGVYCISVA